MAPNLFLFAAALLTGLPAAWCQGPGAAPVRIAPVIKREVAPSQKFVANVRAHRTSTIGSAVDGRVLDYKVDAGQRVEAGETLAELRTGTIEIQIEAAKAELSLREAELRELENGSRPEEIELAEATLAATKAANDYAKAKLQRAERLYRGAAGFSQDEFEAAKSEALTAVARLQEAQSSLELVQQGPRQEKIDQAKARVNVQKQVVAELEDRYEKYFIKTPFTGYVSAELTEVGAWLSQGDTVAEVVEINPVEVEVFVPESSIRFVKQGDTCNVTVEALPGENFKGTIEQVVPQADNRSRTFPVRVMVENEVENLERRLLPGMLARVALPTGLADERLLVSKDAVISSPNASMVFKLAGESTQQVFVTLGPALGTWISVQSTEPGALKPGDAVVTLGNERLRPGQPVKVIGEDRPPGEDS